MNPHDEVEAKDRALQVRGRLTEYARRGPREAENALLFCVFLDGGYDIHLVARRLRELREGGHLSERNVRMEFAAQAVKEVADYVMAEDDV